MSFTVKTEPRENRQLAVTIEVDQQRVEQELRKAAAKIAQQYAIPGFRKGKAPYHIIVQQVGLPSLYSEFVDELGQELFRKAIEQENIQPYAQSSLEDVQFDPLTYKLIVPLEPTVKLGDYRSLRVEEEPVAIDMAEVDRRLEMYREEYAGWQEVERPCAYGDLITMDVKSVIVREEGEENAEEVVLDETDWEVTLDEEHPLEPAGLDKEILGMRAGEEKEFVISWPADSQSIYAGKQAKFFVKIKKVQGYEKPELNDEFAKLVGPDYATLDDLRNAIIESLTEEARREAARQYTDKVLDALVEISELDYPPVVIEDQIDAMLNDLDRRIRQMGLDGLEAFLRQTGQTEESYREQLRPTATQIARRNLVLSEVIRQEGIEASEEEIDAHVRRMLGADAAGEIDPSARELADLLRFGPGRSMVISQVLTEKATQLLEALARGQEPPVFRRKTAEEKAASDSSDETPSKDAEVVDEGSAEAGEPLARNE
ncbi:MAG: trigger factor [Caldilinea sp.]|nr:trigger factor [Caldilinea sp.]MDW8442028.1 trigger factor [Caldilineaceae bacterium]